MLTVVIAKNPLDRTTWARHENVEKLTDFLLNQFEGVWPETTRIYHEEVAEDHDVTPHQHKPGSIEKLDTLAGVVYVVVWPGAQIAIGVGVQLAFSLVAIGLKALLTKDEKVTARKIPQGSPNNAPGDRQNAARVMDRIPDIYGRVKTTPDLIQAPFITYENNQQVEISYMCIGQGSYFINADEIKEGEAKVSSIPGASVEIYGPNQVPGSGTPEVTVGAAIDQQLVNVVPIKEVNGQTLLAPNNTFVHGDMEAIDPNPSTRNAALFEYLGSGLGTILFNCASTELGAGEVMTKFQAGDKVGLDFKLAGVSVYEELILDSDSGDFDPSDRPALGLLPESEDDDYYEITDIVEGLSDRVTVTLAIPASKIAEWEKIAVYNPGGNAPNPFPVGSTPGLPNDIAADPADAGTCYNRCSIMYLLNFRQGPFFVNDPGMQWVQINLVAPNGLWFDDGRQQHAIGKIIEGGGPVTNALMFVVELTPADEDGNAIGPKEIFDEDEGLFLIGSGTRRDLIGSTHTIVPSFTGRFLFSCYRKSPTPFRLNLRSYVRKSAASDSRYLVDSRLGEDGASLMIMSDLETPGAAAVSPYWMGNFQTQDEVVLSNAYSMSEPIYPNSTLPITQLGNITTALCRRVSRRFFREDPERRLNITVTRELPLYDNLTDTFLSPIATTRGLDALFDVLRNQRLGNIPDEKIDIVGIFNAFNDVNTSFSDTTVTNFSHTFDNKDTSLEEMLLAISESCLVTLYRQGDIIKAIADVSTQDSALLFNHRNMISDPGEQRNIQFATEEEYDGVEIEYFDNSDDNIQLYTIPATGACRNALKVNVAGVRNRTKAAIHAWRAYQQLIYRDTITEFDTTDEGSLGLINERVLVADQINPNTKDGEIIDSNGLILYTSQEAQVFGESTLFLQGFQGQVAAVPVTQGDNQTSLVLAAPLPAGILHTDVEGAMNTKYFLVSNDTTATTAFRIADKQQKDNGSYSITAYNYTEAYYFYDAIQLWINFKQISGFPSVNRFDDIGPYALLVTPSNETNFVNNDPVRGHVYDSETDTESILVESSFFSAELPQDHNYSIVCWVFNNGDGFHIAKSEDTGSELVFFVTDLTHHLAVIHDGDLKITGPSVIEDEWNHVAVTYDASADILTLYLNGELEDQETSVVGYDAFDDWRLLNQLVGRADSLRIYRTCKPPEFIRELYQKELIE